MVDEPLHEAGLRYMNPLPISAFIITYNEEKNIARCLDSIAGWVEEIFIVDSGSSDATISICKKYTTKIYHHPFEYHAKQLKWAIENLPFKNEWIMRIDADEHYDGGDVDALVKIINEGKIDGVFIKIKIFFMDRWMRHGVFYPNLRIFKKSKASVEDRRVDEHIKINGRTIFTDINFADKNYDRQNNISRWIDKHNRYATLEAIDYLINRHNPHNANSIGSFAGNSIARKRWTKENVYYRLPPFLRAAAYFIYRYFFQLGFLDGKEGLIFHFLQGFWYRFLVDAKIYELCQKKRTFIGEDSKFEQVLKQMV